MNLYLKTLKFNIIKNKQIIIKSNFKLYFNIHSFNMNSF